jgi:phosphoribosyl-ATP pyrophosphohydrolase
LKGIEVNIETLFEIIQSRRQEMPAGSYTTSLFTEGLPRIAQKVGEEGTEVVVAALSQDDQRLIEEIADLTFHTLVLLSARGLRPAQVAAELEKRHK